jgi:hypothetical protein
MSRSSISCSCSHTSHIPGLNNNYEEETPDFDDDLSHIRVHPLLGNVSLLDDDVDDGATDSTVMANHDCSDVPLWISIRWQLSLILQLFLVVPKAFVASTVVFYYAASLLFKLVLVPTNWIYTYRVLRELTGLEKAKVYREPPSLKLAVEERGYRFEEHIVQTKDGYYLALHRITDDPDISSSLPRPSRRPVVFLQHGLKCSSADFVVGAGMAFEFARRGYDVWMGNFRGNIFSRRHHTLTPKDDRFWKFSWQEHGTYDLPRMIDHVLCTTGCRDMR